MSTSSAPAARRPSAGLAAGLSLILPGLGQAYAGQRYRGAVVALATAVAVLTVAWYGVPGWYLVPAGLWLWNVWDAAGSALGRPRSAAFPVLLGLGAAFGLGWQVMQIDLSSADLGRALAIMRPMLSPDFVEPRLEKRAGYVEVQVPCSAQPPAARREADGLSVFATSDCVAVGETLIVSAAGLWPNTDTNVYWVTPIGDPKMIGPGESSMLVVRTDDSGAVSTPVTVPSTALASQPDPTLPLLHKVMFEQARPIGGFQISTTGRYVFQGMAETLALALMATTLSVLVAIPLSFLAARNLMSANPLTLALYVAIRTLLNIVRSIESLIVAIVFVVIVGLGPFAGVIALTLHSVAALAKLYSEVIEGIDPGPIEAMRATGANWLQVVRYGVLPQVVPPFTAFTLYRWDINVRSSTIIGFVGGGGIGFFLIQWINIADFRAVSAAFIAIGVVVIALDTLSARVRQRLA